MKKEHLELEFRYEGENGYTSKHLSLGMFDKLEDAIKAGNEALKTISKHFEVREGDIFSLDGGCFGLPNKLVTNCCYSADAIKYFLKISTYNTDLEKAINLALKDRQIFLDQS